MMRFLIALCLLGLMVAACGPAAEIPTPLPTAVPPDVEAGGGGWAVSFQYEFPTGMFGKGKHRYAFLGNCPVISPEDFDSDWHFFEISEDVVNQPAPLYLRLHGLSADAFNPSAITNTLIHPERQIIAVVHLVGLARPAAELASECEILVFWDDGGRQLLTAGEPFEP